ncbi:MAG: hypothetical protein ACRD07_11250, partial [Acidimicrobiales bacterium]
MRAAQLWAERAALVATLPPDPTAQLCEAQRRATQIREQLDDLHDGIGRYANTAIDEAARRLRTAEQNHNQARQSTTSPGAS